MAWTDDELRAAIHEAARNAGAAYGSLADIAHEEITDLRHLLTALGIDHQPKPELPIYIGAHIRDVVSADGATCEVMTLGTHGQWYGVDQSGRVRREVSESITSWRPLSLEALEEGDGDD